MRFIILNIVLTLIGLNISVSHCAESTVYKKLEVLSKVLSYVETNYIEEQKTEELIDNAVKGLLSGLDPHTVYMPPSLYREMKEDTTGEFGGVGIEISVKDEQLTVVTPIEDTPAEKAGVKAGDVILKIEGVSAKGMSLLEAVKKIRGPHGSKVNITLQHKGETTTYDVVLNRERIAVKSVTSELVDKEYGYIRIKNFQEKTERELSRQFERIQKETGKAPLKGLILDLRNNPGGLLEQAIRVADLFLEAGVIVSTMGRKGSFQEVKMAHKDGTLPEMPMITLVNEGTASASEIVAGALQDHRRSVILGAQTFGKGSVQTIIDLEDGSGLKLTIARYYTPKGRSIQALGIAPDITISEVPPPLADAAYVREKDLKGHIESPPLHDQGEKSEPHKSVPKSTLNIETDIQLRRALEYLKTWEVFRTTLLLKISPS